MRARTAVIASIAVHGVVLVVMVARWQAPRRVKRAEPEAEVATPAQAPAFSPPTAAEPLTVVLLEPDRERGGDRDRDRLRGGDRDRDRDRDRLRAASAAAIVAREPRAQGERGEAPAAKAGEPGTDGAVRRGLGMRGPELRLGEAYLERAGKQGHGGPEAPTRQVDSVAGGKGAIYDRVTTVSIERDGTAHFDDQPDVDLRWDVRLPTPDAVKDALVTAAGEIRAWYADPYADARVGKPQDVPAYLKMKPGDCDHWDDACSVELRGREEDSHLKKLARGQIAHGKAELSDAIMRRLVGDPYASRKLKLLDDSRAARALMGDAHRAEDRARSAELMQRNLEALWRATPDPAARRDVLFTLWDECAEGEASEGEAGQRARAMVIGWIRAKLPAGSPGAFTTDELATRAAHRQSNQPFTPYE